jgi:outer membrane protein TolC
MRLGVGALARWGLALLTAAQTGCVVVTTARPAALALGAPSTSSPQLAPERQEAIRQAAYQPTAPDTGEMLPQPTRVGAPPAATGEPFAGASELSVEALVREVLARNPSLAQMVAAWEAARARYPQVTSLDDPMFTATLAPAGIGTIEDRNRGYRLDISQKLPWCGKLDLRGQNALAQARAAANSVEDMRLQLVESAKAAFYDYYLVARALEVNAENLRLLRQFRRNAEARYKTGQAPQQDFLQADVEIGRQERRNFTLERMRAVAVARINTLLNLAPDTPLPPPPKQVKVEDALPDAAALRAAALARRPDLQALANRLQAEEASLALAYKDYYPDFQLMAAYDTFWVEKQLRPQVAVQMNLPVRLARRDAAVWEAKARLAERRAELARQVNQINYEVNQAAAEVSESKQSARLYETKVLPAAELNLKSAQTAYEAGQIPFLSLVQAERDVIGLRDQYYELVADYYRRLATLERVVGGPLTPAPGADQSAGVPCNP